MTADCDGPRLCTEDKKCILEEDRCEGEHIYYENVSLPGESHGQYWQYDATGRRRKMVISMQLKHPTRFNREEAGALYAYLEFTRGKRT